VQVTIDLPDDIAEQLIARDGAGLPQAVLEMVAVEGYRSGRLTEAGVMRLLRLTHRTRVDAFLKEHGAYLDYSLDDLERDRETHRRLGLR